MAYGGRKVDFTDLDVEVKNILDAFNSELNEKVHKAVDKTSKQIRKDIRDNIKTSGINDEGGKYARSWSIKKEENGYYIKHTVYSKRPGLPHLLELGHVHIDYSGRVSSRGRTRAFKHIEPAEKKGIEEFEKLLREAIESAGK